MRDPRRGSVLVHVLMTGVVVAVIAAGLMRLTMLRYVASARAAGGAQARRTADAALNKALTYWNATNIVCGNNVPGYSCSPASGASPGLCNCTCTPFTATDATIVVTDPDGTPGPPCNLSVQAPDPMP